MILYATQLQTSHDLNPHTFFQTLVVWNQNQRSENRIHRLDWNGQLDWKAAQAGLSLEFLSVPQEGLYGSRFVKTDGGVTWKTDVIYHQKKHRLSVLLDRSYQPGLAVRNEIFSTPYVLKTLFEQGLLADDNGWPVDWKPMVLDQDNVEQAARKLKDSEFRLPVVLISCTRYDTWPVDVNRLAHDLKGAAHVLVQKNRNLQEWMNHAFHETNPYNGYIHIYFPNESYPEGFPYYEDGGTDQE